MKLQFDKMVQVNDKVFVKLASFINNPDGSLESINVIANTKDIDHVFKLGALLTGTIRVTQKTEDIDPITGKAIYIDLAANGEVQNGFLFKPIKDTDEEDTSLYSQIREICKDTVTQLMPYKEYLQNKNISCEFTIKLAKDQNTKNITNKFNSYVLAKKKAQAHLNSLLS